MTDDNSQGNVTELHTSSKRIGWIDAAKGLGILLMIMGHTPIDSKFLYYIYSFHMPLFFILGGITFSIKKDFKSFVWHKFKSLLIPYAFFACCLILFYYSLKLIFHSRYDPVQDAISFVLQDHHTYLWFLVTLFVCEILAYVVIKCIHNKLIKYETIALIITTVLLITFHYFTVTQGWINLVWTLDLVPVSLAFVLTGVLYRKHGGAAGQTKSAKYIGLLFLISLGISTLNFVFNGRVDMFMSQFDYYPLFVTGALAGAYFLLVFARRITAPQWLTYIGVYSLVYYGLHKFVIDISLLICDGIGVPYNLSSWSGVILALINVVLACILIYPACSFINRRCPWILGKW